MKVFSPQGIFSLSWLYPAVALAASLVTHDGAFVPDHIMHVTAQNISQACDTRYSVVVNGTAPGPEIRLRAGQPAWIRVYNDMEDANLTMVSRRLPLEGITLGPNSERGCLPD